MLERAPHSRGSGESFCGKLCCKRLLIFHSRIDGTGLRVRMSRGEGGIPVLDQPVVSAVVILGHQRVWPHHTFARVVHRR